MANLLQTWLNKFTRQRPQDAAQKAYTPVSTSFITTGSPIYLNLQTNLDLLYAYQTIPELAGIINKKADCFANANVCVYRRDNDGKVKKVENHPLVKRFNKPNPIETKYEFLLKLYKQYKVFGNAYIFNYVGSYGFAPKPENIKNIWLLPSQYTTLTPQPQVKYSATTQSEVIKEYIVNFNTVAKFEPETICHLKESNLNIQTNYGLLGQSLLTTLQYPLSTIAQAYEAQNVGLTKRGASGVLSRKQNDGVSSAVMTRKDIELLQNQYQMYGLSKDQFQVIISDYEFSWVQIGSPLKDLMINENITACVKAICDVLNYPFVLVSNGDESKYSNREYANKEQYVDAIIPESKRLADVLSNFYGLYANNEWIEFDFSHIEYLQADKKLQAERNQLEVNTILSINTALSYNQIDYDTAVNTLSIIANMSKEQAAMLISKPKQKADTPQPIEPTKKLNGYEYTRN